MKKGEAENIASKPKNRCYVCNKKTNVVCKDCPEFVCFAHSSLVEKGSEERICDECIEGFLSGQLPRKSTMLETVHNDIQIIVEQREKNTQELCKISNTIQRKKEQFEKEEQDSAEKEIELARQVKESTEALKRIEEGIEKNRRDIEKMENNIKFSRTKCDENGGKLQKNLSELKKITQERNEVFTELNELRDFVRTQVPLRLVKRIVCASCYPKVLVEYHKVFKPETAGTEVRNQSISEPKKLGACSSCSLF